MVGFHVARYRLEATRLATLHNSAMPGPLTVTPRHKGTGRVYGDDDTPPPPYLMFLSYLSLSAKFILSYLIYPPVKGPVYY